MAATDLSSRKYVRWDTPGVEDVPADEEADIQAVADQINEMQKQQFDQHRHVYTGTHCRTQGIVKGTFTVPDDLPTHLKQGELFAKGGSYPIACRYSTEPGAPGFDDRIPAPRGFSMKIFNVHGDFYEAGKDTPTQDIEFNNTPVIELANAKVTREIFDIRLKHGLLPNDGMKAALKKRDDTDLQMARFEVPNQHIASYRQYSQSAFRFGDYVFKYSIVPSTETMKKLEDQSVKPDDEGGSDIHHKWLQNFHNTHTAVWDFQVQLLENLEEQSVEYSGTEWDEEKYPWQTVAKLEIPPQEAFSLERKAFWEDHLRLDPWHGLKSYQPLGGSNRLRRGVYPRSSALRRKLNGRKEIAVKDINEIP